MHVLPAATIAATACAFIRSMPSPPPCRRSRVLAFLTWSRNSVATATGILGLSGANACSDDKPSSSLSEEGPPNQEGSGHHRPYRHTDTAPLKTQNGKSSSDSGIFSSASDSASNEDEGGAHGGPGASSTAAAPRQAEGAHTPANMPGNGAFGCGNGSSQDMVRMMAVARRREPSLQHCQPPRCCKVNGQG